MYVTFENEIKKMKVLSTVVNFVMKSFFVCFNFILKN